MKNGAVDFLEKPVDPDKLMAPIQTIFRNQQSDSADDKAIELWENLSGREKQIATLYSKGNSQREISDYLSLQQKTINAHIQNIYKKTWDAFREEIQKLFRNCRKSKVGSIVAPSYYGLLLKAVFAPFGTENFSSSAELRKVLRQNLKNLYFNWSFSRFFWT